jgi:molybdopterin/thiamine biosynthesis adenylyltransferase
MDSGYKWHEDAQLKNLLDAELGALNRGLDGEFELLKLYEPSETEGRIVCVGNLSYDLDKKQAIQIIFPTKYPYAPPRVISVRLALSPDGIPLMPLQPINFGKGNQYGDGALCLFRNDFWDYRQHNIGWVLRRAQKWLRSATSANGFKPEEIVEEHNAPIPHVGQVLFPKPPYLPHDAKMGEFILTQFKPNYYILADNELTNQPFPLNVGREPFKWFRIDEGITFKALFKTFTSQDIVRVFESQFGINILEGNMTKSIALYIPSDENPWHFFKFIITSQGFGFQITANYFLGRVLSEELYLRTSDIFDSKALLMKRVTIIGLGAIGSEVARSLARNAVGHFNLFDNDTFEVGNLVRHAADLFYVGESKVDVVKSLIQKSNPNISVNTYRIDVLNDSGLLEKSLEASDLCLVLTGDDAVDYMINDKLTSRFNIPFLFARVAAGAVSGSIQVVDHDSACLRCLSAQNLDQLPKPKTKTVYSELKSEYGSCSTPPLPGSEIDTKEVALQVTRIALQLLLPVGNISYPPVSGKQYYWHGPYGSETNAPFTWVVRDHQKDHTCSICKK